MPQDDLRQAIEAARAADDAYQAALMDHYGPNRAATFRYLPDRQPAHVREFGLAKRRADEGWAKPSSAREERPDPGAARTDPAAATTPPTGTRTHEDSP